MNGHENISRNGQIFSTTETDFIHTLKQIKTRLDSISNSADITIHGPSLKSLMAKVRQTSEVKQSSYDNTVNLNGFSIVFKF